MSSVIIFSLSDKKNCKIVELGPCKKTALWYLLQHEQKFYYVLKSQTLCLLCAHSVNSLTVLLTCMSDARVS